MDWILDLNSCSSEPSGADRIVLLPEFRALQEAGGGEWGFGDAGGGGGSEGAGREVEGVVQ